jgi:repressor LexA
MFEAHLDDQLTARQRAVFRFIKEKIQGRGYGPTIREIGHRFDINSPNGVVCHLRALEKKGLIRREPNRSRAIQLASKGAGAPGLPLVGEVAAGVLHEAIEQHGRIDFSSLLNKNNHVALKVRGDSMIDAQIADGDYVVLRRQKTARRGDMVVAETDDGEATLKYWFPEKNRIRLQPANARMSPLYVQDAKVLGIVVGVVRTLK